MEFTKRIDNIYEFLDTQLIPIEFNSNDEAVVGNIFYWIRLDEYSKEYDVYCRYSFGTMTYRRIGVTKIYEEAKLVCRKHLISHIAKYFKES